MQLIDLSPQFIRYGSRVETWQVVDGDHNTWRERGCPCKDVTGPREYKVHVATLVEAQGIFFDCPICKDKQAHSVEVTFRDRGVPDNLGTHNKDGVPVRWAVTGNDFSDLSTQPSILLQGGCGWHGYITNGNAA